MADTVKDLLTDKEKGQYYEIVAKMERQKGTLPDSEREKLFQEASEILLGAVRREIKRREDLKNQE